MSKGSTMASTSTQTLNASIGAVAAPTRFVETGGRRLAYRSIGSGTPIVLATRFRGTMDYWDPAFLDALVDNDFQVVTFDYSGLGHSTGEKTYDAGSLAKDAGDLIEALDLEDVVMSGWSLGGVAAQVALALFPERIGHAVLLATTPPGHLVKQGDELFYDTVSKPAPDLEDEVTIFFEPASAASREAARASRERIAQRTTDRGEDVPVEWAMAQLGSEPRNPMFPSEDILALLKSTTTPILHIGGDHDLIFPVENWYALNEQLPTLQLLTFPRAGHGPQHQHPEASAEHIATFVRARDTGR
jgi:pimeloyl-ACP methyl ester carboxylesterase